MPDPTTLLAWSCIALGGWLAGYALYARWTGRMRGYYQDHEYAEGSAGFARWFWIRLVLGLVSLVLGIAFL